MRKFFKLDKEIILNMETVPLFCFCSALKNGKTSALDIEISLETNFNFPHQKVH